MITLIFLSSSGDVDRIYSCVKESYLFKKYFKRDKTKSIYKLAQNSKGCFKSYAHIIRCYNKFGLKNILSIKFFF